jgi:oligoendopeptidase F
MDHEATLLHGKLPLLQLPLRVRSNVCLLTLREILQEGKQIVPKLKKALSAGSSVSPMEIGRIVDLDVANPDFWKLGLKRFEHFITEIEKIVK